MLQANANLSFNREQAVLHILNVQKLLGTPTVRYSGVQLMQSGHLLQEEAQKR
jgi:hypothetical protein